MSRFLPHLTGNEDVQWQARCSFFVLLWIAAHPLDARDDGSGWIKPQGDDED